MYLCIYRSVNTCRLPFTICMNKMESKSLADHMVGYYSNLGVHRVHSYIFTTLCNFNQWSVINPCPCYSFFNPVGWSILHRFYVCMKHGLVFWFSPLLWLNQNIILNSFRKKHRVLWISAFPPEPGRVCCIYRHRNHLWAKFREQRM